MIYFKGMTAYEFQIGRFYIKIIHLKGGKWNSWKIWERFSFGIDRS